jgi:hypothetical protein
LPKLAVHSDASGQAIPKNAVGREGLIEVCQRDGSAGRGDGGAKKRRLG